VYVFRSTIQTYNQDRQDENGERGGHTGSGILETSVKIPTRKKVHPIRALLSAVLVQRLRNATKEFRPYLNHSSASVTQTKPALGEKRKETDSASHRHLGTSTPALRATTNNGNYYNELL